MMFDRLRALFDLFGRIPDSLLLFLTRIGVGLVFWTSGQTKVDGWALRPETIDLFRDEYKLPLLSPEMAAPMAAMMEHLLPLMLFVGLGSRFAALGLLGMTLVIQVFVYPDAWNVHIFWAAALGWIIAKGPGGIALDRFFPRRAMAA